MAHARPEAFPESMMRRLPAIALLCLPLLGACTYHRTLFSPLQPEDTPTGEV